jgi:hypothetical protein
MSGMRPRVTIGYIRRQLFANAAIAASRVAIMRCIAVLCRRQADRESVDFRVRAFIPAFGGATRCGKFSG